MVARANTVAFQGIEVVDVGVQVQVASGLPAFTLVGLPDKAVAERVARAQAFRARVDAERPDDAGEPVAGRLDTGARNLLLEAAERLGLSARAYFRVQRVAATIADLDGSESVNRAHLAEALSYRHSERKGSQRRSGPYGQTG